MTSPAFSSCLAGSLSRYVQLRRLANGSDYSGQTKLLLHWDRFLSRWGWHLPLVTRELVDSYSRTLARYPTTRGLRMSAVRQFCLYLRQSQPRSHVPERRLSPSSKTTWPPRGGSAPTPCWPTATA